MEQRTVLLVLLAILIVSTMGLYLIVKWISRYLGLSKEKERVSRFVTSSDSSQTAETGKKADRLENLLNSGFREKLNKSLARISSEKTRQKLSSAYWPITDTEFILSRYVGTILAFILGLFITGSILGGLFLATLALMLPPIILDLAISNRQRKFSNQLLDVLILIKGAVQAGYGLMQALDLAVNEIQAPASEEFSRVIREVRLGLTLENALTNLSKRMDNDDLYIVVTAIIINTQVGGNLSVVLESTISTIRSRMQIMAEIRSLTSYSRLVANILTLTPIFAAIGLYVISGDYFEPVKTSLIAQIGLGMALLMVLIGNLWLRRMTDIKV